ncbi:MAG TPA: peptide chain release factor 2 [Patescibacteria group bacterium]
MYELATKIKSISADFEKIIESINLPKKEERLKELEARSTDPNLWDDQENARSVMQELGGLKDEISQITNLKEEIEIVKSLVGDEKEASNLEKEIQRIEKEITSFKLKTYLSGPYDAKNAIMGIHAGQGGTEAMDWASMLLRMYLRYAEKKGWRTEILDETKGEEAGIKGITFRVVGNNAYGYLKGEVGTHRLVRQSPFNADKLRQTSFALVEAMPELENVDLPDIEIKDEDLEWQFFRAGSQGGQNVNKVSTAVRLIHNPSGLVVTAQTERFQEQNRKIALNLLRARLWARALEEAKATKKSIKGEYRPASWGTQIRSYVLHPYKMVKDLRTGVETSNTEAVLGGELDEFIQAELKLAK